MKKKKQKITDPVKLEEMRARMAKARAAKLEKQQPVEATVGGSDGFSVVPVADSPPLPAVPSANPKEWITPPFENPNEWPAYMPVSEGGEVHEMRVISIPQNPTLVICDCGMIEGRCHVEVGVNANFVVGMKLHAFRKAPPQHGFWKLHGPLPRDKGRW